MMLQRCSGASDVAATVARSACRAAQEVDGERHVALTGGGVGIQTLRELAVLLRGRDLDRLHLWWGDERFLPRDHADRNDRQARHNGLDELRLDPRRIHPVPGAEECGLDEATLRYDAALRRLVPAVGGWPRLDVVLLGMGPDGHVASLFPGQPWEEGQASALAVRDAPKPPPRRVSLALPVLVTASVVILGIAGAGKRAALQDALAGDRELPCGELIAQRDQAGRETLVYADHAALGHR